MKGLESSHESLEVFACRPANCRNEIKGVEINGSFTPNVLKTDIMSNKRSTFSLPYLLLFLTKSPETHHKARRWHLRLNSLMPV